LKIISDKKTGPCKARENTRKRRTLLWLSCFSWTKPFVNQDSNKSEHRLGGIDSKPMNMAIDASLCAKLSIL